MRPVALIALVGLWAFSAFLMPKTASEISKIAYPSPSLGQFQTAMQETRATGLGRSTPRERLNAYRQELLTKYGVADVAQLPIYWVSASMQKLEEMDHEVYDHYYKGLDTVYRQQQQLQDRLGVLSPGLPLSSVSMGLTGTDLLHHQEFVQAAESARRAMVAKVNAYLNEMAVGFNKNLLTDASVSIESADRVLIADEKIFRMVDPFHYSPPTVQNILADYHQSFVLLGLWLVLATGFAALSATRMRPAGR